MKNKKDMFKPYEEEREKIALKLSQDIPFIDPYYYQFYIEERVKLIKEVKGKNLLSWNLNPYISNDEIKGWIGMNKKWEMDLIWGKH